MNPGKGGLKMGARISRGATRLSRRELLGLGLAGLVLAGSAGCRQERGQAVPAGGPEEPKRGGSLRVAYNLQPPSLDPHETISAGLHNPAGLVYSRLVRFKTGAGVDPNQRTPVPDLAERWEQPDDVTYVFYLRPGVKFHDIPPVNGRELTADDVRFTFERILKHPAAGQKYLFADVDKIETPDRYTVRFVLKQPNAAFINYIASPFAWIIPREVEQLGDLKTRMIGTGPFALKEYTPNVSLVLTRNPSYFVPGRPLVDEIQWLIITDESTYISSFRARQVDILPLQLAIQPHSAESLRQAVPDARVVEVPFYGWRHIAFRTDRKELPFADRRVRQAISLALDRQAMVEVLARGKAVLDGPISASLVDWVLPVDRLGPASRYYKRDLAEARRLLADAGYPNGFKFSLKSTQQLGPIHAQWLEMVKANLAEVGVEVNLVWEEFTTFVTTTYVGKYEEAMAGQSAPSVEADEFLAVWYGPGNPRNQSYVNDPVLNEMVARQRRNLDPNRRKEILYEIQRYLAEQQYYVTGIAEFRFAFAHSYVKDCYPLQQYGQYELTDVWLDR
jgi:peptide/nickel transport system substrate-binding protein